MALQRRRVAFDFPRRFRVPLQVTRASCRFLVLMDGFETADSPRCLPSPRYIKILVPTWIVKNISSGVARELATCERCEEKHLWCNVVFLTRRNPSNAGLKGESWIVGCRGSRRPVGRQAATKAPSCGGGRLLVLLKHLLATTLEVVDNIVPRE